MARLGNLMRAGKSAPDALHGLLIADDVLATSARWRWWIRKAAWRLLPAPKI
jgi:hypothetical protein